MSEPKKEENQAQQQLLIVWHVHLSTHWKMKNILMKIQFDMNKSQLFSCDIKNEA